MRPEKVLQEVVSELQSLKQSTTSSEFRAAVQKTIAQVPACVFIAEPNGQLVAASAVALALVGHTPVTLRQLSVSDLAADVEQPHVDHLWDAFRRTRRQTGDYRLRAADGTAILTQYAAAANVVADLSVSVLVVSPTEPAPIKKRRRPKDS